MSRKGFGRGAPAAENRTAAARRFAQQPTAGGQRPGAVGDPQQAEALFSRLKTAAASEPVGQTKALIYRDAARLERAQRQPERAQQDYRRAMVAGGITPTLPQGK